MARRFRKTRRGFRSRGNFYSVTAEVPLTGINLGPYSSTTINSGLLYHDFSRAEFAASIAQYLPLFQRLKIKWWAVDHYAPSPAYATGSISTYGYTGDPPYSVSGASYPELIVANRTDYDPADTTSASASLAGLNTALNWPNKRRWSMGAHNNVPKRTWFSRRVSSLRPQFVGTAGPTADPVSSTNTIQDHSGWFDCQLFGASSEINDPFIYGLRYYCLPIAPTTPVTTTTIWVRRVLRFKVVFKWRRQVFPEPENLLVGPVNEDGAESAADTQVVPSELPDNVDSPSKRVGVSEASRDLVQA